MRPGDLRNKETSGETRAVMAKRVSSFLLAEEQPVRSF